MDVQRGATSYIIPLRIVDTNGIPKTGIAFNTAGLAVYSLRELDTSVSTITLATTTLGVYANSGVAGTGGGFVEIDATKFPGDYELSLPNAAVGAGDASRWVTIQLVGTNIYAQPLRIDLVAINKQDAVRIGLTALPNAAAEAAGGLYTRGSGAGQINQDANGRIDSNLKAILGTLLTETIAGQLAGGLKKLLDVTTPVFTLLSINQTGDSFARLGAPAGASVSADIAATKALLPTALVGGKMDSHVNDVAANAITAAAIATDAIGSAQLAASGVTEIQTGLATSANQTTINNNVLALPTAIQNAAAVLDVAASAHNIAATIGAKINSSGGGGGSDPLLNDASTYSGNQIGARMALIGSAAALVPAAVNAAGDITLYQGKDYRIADQTAVHFTSTSTLALTAGGTSVALRFAGQSFTATVTGSAGAWLIDVPLTGAQTAALGIGTLGYQLIAIVSGSPVVDPPPLGEGSVTIKPSD